MMNEAMMECTFRVGVHSLNRDLLEARGDPEFIRSFDCSRHVHGIRHSISFFVFYDLLTISFVVYRYISMEHPHLISALSGCRRARSR